MSKLPRLPRSVENIGVLSRAEHTALSASSRAQYSVATLIDQPVNTIPEYLLQGRRARLIAVRALIANTNAAATGCGIEFLQQGSNAFETWAGRIPGVSSRLFLGALNTVPSFDAAGPEADLRRIFQLPEVVWERDTTIRIVVFSGVDFQITKITLVLQYF